MNAKNIVISASLLVSLTACATTKKNTAMDKPEETTKSTVVSTPVPTAAPKVAMDKGGDYNIKSHDTLWDISSRKEAFEDPYYWPALFRANRDVIEDPDLIYINETIKIPKGMSGSDLEDAKKRALKAPAYEPHTSPKPREQLEYLLD